jgi:predicted Zn-dependent protease
LIRPIDSFSLGNLLRLADSTPESPTQDPNDYSATLQLGRIALLSNRLDDAQKWLEKAMILRPNDTDVKVMLVEAFYRRDDFQKAAAALNGVNVSGNKLVIEQYPTLSVAMLESFKGATPYELQGTGTITRVKFLKTAAGAQRARKRR